MVTNDNVGKTCPFCQSPIKPDGQIIVCHACGMPHHAECWQENRGCATYGCPGGAARPVSQPVPPPPYASQYPTSTGLPPTPVVSAAATQQYLPPERPTAALVIGIVLIVFAGLGFISLAFLLLQMFSIGFLGPAMPMGQMVWGLIMNLISIPLYAVMGIGLIRMAPWARQGTVILLWSLMAVTIVNMVIQHLLFPQAPPPGAGGEFFQTIIIVTVVVTILFSAAINGLMIYFLSQPQVKQAFEAKRQTGQQG